LRRFLTFGCHVLFGIVPIPSSSSHAQASDQFGAPLSSTISQNIQNAIIGAAIGRVKFVSPLLASHYDVGLSGKA
jgi:hypothetical protein